MLYACQDFEHDRKVGLNSIPQALGLNGAFWVARVMHAGMLVLLVWIVFLFGLGLIAKLGIIVVAALLFYEHSIISPQDLRRMNAAFFTLNGIISMLYFISVATDLIVH